MDKNILLTIAYDGSQFHGWQRQPNCRTVQGYLEQTMSSLFKREILISGTSRTDAGVHALDQKATFVTDINIPIDRLPRVINNALAGRETGAFAMGPVRILDAVEMPEGFHARFDCQGKEYIYKIKTGAGNSADMVFERNYAYFVKEELDVDAMKRAAEFLVGTHDFKSFEASGGNPRETTVRTIFDAHFEVTGNSLDFHIKGDGFLYNMVRIITGTLVDIGRGKFSPEDMTRIIEAKDRTRAGHTAPPYGLYLAEVYFQGLR